MRGPGPCALVYPPPRRFFLGGFRRHGDVIKEWNRNTTRCLMSLSYTNEQIRTHTHTHTHWTRIREYIQEDVHSVSPSYAEEPCGCYSDICMRIVKMGCFSIGGQYPQIPGYMLLLATGAPRLRIRNVLVLWNMQKSIKWMNAMSFALAASQLSCYTFLYYNNSLPSGLRGPLLLLLYL